MAHGQIPYFFTDATEKLIMNKVTNKKAYNIKVLKFKQFTASHQNIHTNKKKKKRATVKFNFVYVALAAEKLPYFGYKSLHKNDTY